MLSLLLTTATTSLSWLHCLGLDITFQTYILPFPIVLQLVISPLPSSKPKVLLKFIGKIVYL